MVSEVSVQIQNVELKPFSVSVEFRKERVPLSLVHINLIGKQSFAENSEEMESNRINRLPVADYVLHFCHHLNLTSNMYSMV